MNNNESFVYIKNIGWFDWAEVVDDFSNDEYLTYYTFDNFPIKAYCEFE